LSFPWGGFALIILGGILAVLLIWWGPIWTIWALNLLFGLDIPVTFWTWLSAAWLSAVVSGGIISRKN
jgi:hypothetical protein